MVAVPGAFAVSFPEESTLTTAKFEDVHTERCSKAAWLMAIPDGNLWWPAAGRQHEVPGLKPARISDTPGTSESSETVVRVHHAIERHAGNAVEIVGEGDRRCRDPDDGQSDESEAGDGNAAAAVAGDFHPRMVGLRMVPRNGLFQAASVAAC